VTYVVPKRFRQRLVDVPVVVLDNESTGVDMTTARSVECALVRFENGVPVAHVSSLINPGIPIPAEATAIHGYVDDDVKDAPSISDFWHSVDKRFLEDTQLSAYNAGYDSHLIPRDAPIDHTWPMLDALVIVREVDRFARGQGRHKLEAACQRHGIAIGEAHKALTDATAAGHLLFKLAPRIDYGDTLGGLLEWTRSAAARQWYDFNDYVSRKQQQEQQP